MKVTTEELEHCEVSMLIEVEAKKEQDMLKKAAKRIAREVRIPGFRPGKAPYHTIVRRFGIESVQQEALEKSIENLLEKALSEAELEPYAQIQLDEVNWDPLTLRVTVPGPPQIELGEYRETRLEVDPIEISDEEIEESLAQMQEQNATWVPVERPAELGDLLSMSVVEKDGDEILNEHEAVEYELALPITSDDTSEADTDDDAEVSDEASDEESEGSEGEDEEGAEVETPAPTQPDLTTPLLGLSAEETKTFTITYPESFQDERYAGKEITFDVEVSSVKEKELDPLDDDFAQARGEFETLDELKADVRKNITEQKERVQNQEVGQEVIAKLLETATFDWPPALEESGIDQEVANFQRSLQQSNLNLKDYLAMENKSEEEFREEIRGRVISSLKEGLILSEVTKLEKLEVSQTEILNQAKMFADMVGGGDDSFWQSMISSERYQASLANDILSEKAMRRLAEIAKGVAPDLDALE
ncbi:MAG: trigger factor, partial [Chloroflexota bacterium]